jgi:pre-mRNA-splicing factor CWC22
LENEEKYKAIKSEILGDGSDEEESGSEEDDEDEEEGQRSVLPKCEHVTDS